MLLKIIDIGSGIIVIAALWMIPKNYKAWLLYTLGCATYCYINVRLGSPGQIAINIFGTVIGLRNYLKLRGLKNERSKIGK